MEHSSFGTYPSQGELTSRITRLQELLRQDRQDGALFFQNADLIYLCGSTQAETVFFPERVSPSFWPARLSTESEMRPRSVIWMKCLPGQTC